MNRKPLHGKHLTGPVSSVGLLVCRRMVQKNHPSNIAVTLKLPAEIRPTGTVHRMLSGFSARLVLSQCRALIWQPEVAISIESKRVAPTWAKLPDNIGPPFWRIQSREDLKSRLPSGRRVSLIPFLRCLGRLLAACPRYASLREVCRILQSSRIFSYGFQTGRFNFFKSAANRGSVCKLLRKGFTFVVIRPLSR